MDNKEKELLEVIEKYNNHAGHATIKYDMDKEEIFAECYESDEEWQKNPSNIINIITKTKTHVDIHGNNPTNKLYVINKLDEALSLYKDLNNSNRK